MNEGLGGSKDHDNPDVYGFPERYYQTEYPAPGAAELAARVRDLLRQKEVAVSQDPNRGLDHGAYVPLVAMYPDADVPVLQVSMPGLEAEALFNLGRAPTPLREKGVLIFGSGFLTHNMGYAFRLVAAGAVADERPPTTFPVTDWWMDGAFTRRSVPFG